jgi:hypothetical protein
MRAIAAGALASVMALLSGTAIADEGGVSFWVPGFFGSLAAVPQQPGWSLADIVYNTNVRAGGDVALAREFEIGRVPLHFSGTASANVKADVPLDMLIPQYVFATPVLGGQAAVALLGAYGRNDTSLAGTLNGTITLPVGPPFPIMKSIDRTDITWGFGDLIPQASLRWNKGTDNWIIYITGDIPVGAYQSTRLANLGIGHGAVDAGAGYTYFNPQTGHEFSAVLGFTANLENTSTNYTNGVDMHLDWGASQFGNDQAPRRSVRNFRRGSIVGRTRPSRVRLLHGDRLGSTPPSGHPETGRPGNSRRGTFGSTRMTNGVHVTVRSPPSARRLPESGAPTGITTRWPPFDCRNLMWVPSYADQGSRSRSPCRARSRVRAEARDASARGRR